MTTVPMAAPTNALITVGESVPPAPTPEVAFVGCLLHGTASYAVEMLSEVDDEDLADPRLRVVLGLVRQVAARGVDPCPAAVLAQARLTGEPAGAHRLGQLGRLLAHAYTASAPPPAGAFFRRAVLAGALQRALTALSVRLAQIARDCPPAGYHAAATRGLADFHELWNRWTAAGGDTDDHPATSTDTQFEAA